MSILSLIDFVRSAEHIRTVLSWSVYQQQLLGGKRACLDRRVNTLAMGGYFGPLLEVNSIPPPPPNIATLYHIPPSKEVEEEGEYTQYKNQ